MLLDGLIVYSLAHIAVEKGIGYATHEISWLQM